MGLCASLAGALHAQTTKPAATAATQSTAEMKADQQYIKEQFAALIETMSRDSDRYEKSTDANEVDKARILRIAIKEAQNALISDNMEKVVLALTAKQSVDALQNEDKVVKELERILLGLENNDFGNDRDRLIKEYEKRVDEINKILADQKELEKKSNIDSKIKEVNDMFDQILQGACRHHQGPGSSLLGNSEKINSGDADVKKLGDLRDQIRALINEQDAVAAATENATMGRMPYVGEAQKQLSEKTSGVQGKLDEAAKDPKIGEYPQEGRRQREGGRGRLQERRRRQEGNGQAQSAIAQSNKSDAGKGQQQASADLKQAEKALSAALDKLANNTPSGQLAGKQGALGKQTSKLGDKIESAAKSAGLGQDKQQGGDMQKASENMKDASDNLLGQDPKKATGDQKKAIEQLEKKQTEIAQLRKKMEELAKGPSKKQAEEQKKLSEDTAETAKKMDATSDSKNQTPGQDKVQSAQKNQQGASDSLSQDKSPDANKQQKKAIEELELAKQDLQKAIDDQKDKQQAEQLAKIDALLSAVLKRQQVVSKDTKDTYGKGKNDQYERPEALKLAELSNEEGKINEEVEKVHAMLTKDGSTAVFPVVIAKVQTDLTSVQKMLGGKQAGALTQQVQSEIENNLLSLVDAIRKTLADLRRKQQGGNGPGQGQGQGGGKQPLVPPIAELKILLQYQKNVNETTQLVDKLAEASGQKDAHAGQTKALSQEQASVRELTQKLIDKMNEQEKSKPKPGDF